MRLEKWLIEPYLEGRLPLPAAAVQPLLNGYVTLYNHVEDLFGRRPDNVLTETEEIAALSSELMETHYNLPLEMFTHFLGPSMKYSAALWENGVNTLEEAQEAMLSDLCRKMGLKDGERVLDIGCGFGSFPSHVLRRFPNTRVHGLTLSSTQADYMRQKQAKPGHPLNTDRFYLIQDDFNSVRFDQPFERVVSIGVFEHISNLAKALEKIRGFTTAEGCCLLHYIVYRPRKGRPDNPHQDPFFERYIFPGGRIWADTELAKHQQHFRIEEQWFLNGRHYRRTLQAWLDNFLRNYRIIQELTGLENRSMRLWEVYLRACIATFRTRGGRRFGNGQYLLKPA